MRVYTLTLNPAIDLFVRLNELKENVVNRTLEEDYQANGKAINISFILKQMGIESTAMGFLAGFSGEYIEKELKDKGIETDFIYVDGVTRINVFINSDKEYKIVNRGPEIKKIEENELLNKLNQIEKNSYLFVSGSLPPGLNDEIFVEIAKICKEREIRLIFDISSKKLIDCLKYPVYMIKPNEEELKEIFGIVEINDEMIKNIKEKIFKKYKNLENVLLSLGDQGAIFINKNNIIKSNALKGELVNSACAGDTLLSVFVGSLMLGYNLEESLKRGAAGGSLTAFSKGLCDVKDIEKRIDEIKIKNIE